MLSLKNVLSLPLRLWGPGGSVLWGSQAPKQLSKIAQQAKAFLINVIKSVCLHYSLDGDFDAFL